MLWTTFFRPALCLFAVCFLPGCQPDPVEKERTFNFYENTRASQIVKNDTYDFAETNPLDKEHIFDENLKNLVLLNAVVPSECSRTEFTVVQWKYFTELAGDSLATNYLNHYNNLNRYAALMGLGGDYFGADGEYTRLVERTIRDLERFFDMPGEVKVHGQHNETLNDREMLVELLKLLIMDWEDTEYLYQLADEYIERNQSSPVLPESPFFSADGFSTVNGLIVLGDGLVQMFIETGVDPEVVWTGILSHEWVHQIQIKNFSKWYPAGSFETIAESTRHIELEADFISGYYMTHKRGATYNWKRVEQFHHLFFQAGDCAFDLDFHHGTPEQRMAATRAGYELAASMKKQGYIMTPQDLHDYFMDVVIPGII